MAEKVVTVSSYSLFPGSLLVDGPRSRLNLKFSRSEVDNKAGISEYGCYSASSCECGSEVKMEFSSF